MPPKRTSASAAAKTPRSSKKTVSPAPPTLARASGEENSRREGAGSPEGRSRSHSPDSQVEVVNVTGAASGNSTHPETPSTLSTASGLRTVDDVVMNLPTTPLEGGEFIHKVCELITERVPQGQHFATMLAPLLATLDAFQPQDDEGFLYGTPSELSELHWGKEKDKVTQLLLSAPIFKVRWTLLKNALNYLAGQDRFLGPDTTVRDLQLLSRERAQLLQQSAMHVPRKQPSSNERYPSTAESLDLPKLTSYEDLREWVEQIESAFRSKGLTTYLENKSYCDEHMILSEAYTEQLRIALKEGPLSNMVQDTKQHNCMVLFQSVKKELQSDKYRAVDQITYWDKFFQLQLTDLVDTPTWRNHITTYVAKLQGLASEAVKDNTLVRALILRSMQCKEHAEDKIEAHMDAQADWKSLLDKVMTRYRTLTQIEGSSPASRSARRGAATPAPALDQAAKQDSKKKKFNIPDLPKDIDRILRDPEKDRPLLNRWRGLVNQGKVSAPHKYYLYRKDTPERRRSRSDQSPPRGRSARSPASNHRYRDRSNSNRPRHRNTRRSRSRSGDSRRSLSRDSVYDGDRHPSPARRRSSPRSSGRRARSSSPPPKVQRSK